METMDQAAQLLTDKLGAQIDREKITGALSSLLGDGKGSIDLPGLVSRMTSSGDLGSIVKSWLGDGSNAAISPDSLKGLLGESQLSDFASRLGIDANTAVAGLSDVLPQLIDKASSGGSLLESSGALGGLVDAAKGAAKSLLGN